MPDIANISQPTKIPSGGDIGGAVNQKINKIQEAYKPGSSKLYIVGLRGYCEGQELGSDYSMTNCSVPDSTFWFNPTEVLGLGKIFPVRFQTATLQGNKKVSQLIIIVYVMALVANVLTLLTGVFAIFSRLGSVIAAGFSIVCFTLLTMRHKETDFAIVLCFVYYYSIHNCNCLLCSSCGSIRCYLKESRGAMHIR
jgi:hypothetical protein